MNRRKFIERGSLLSAGLMVEPNIGHSLSKPLFPLGKSETIIISTWDFGLKANEIAWNYIQDGRRAIEAVENGIRFIEADANNLSVGIGGLPDRDGIVTLDASIMDESGNAGSVAFLEDIVHPISVARLIMEKTPHVMLSGKGALQFALENGFSRKNLLTDKAKEAWKEWKITSNYHPVVNTENHDTVGLLAIDSFGNISGGCSTSGLAYKIHGRVGDSPIIGAGLYVDNGVGAAVATGLGELVMKNLSTFLVVELMRNGATPQEACEEAIRRIAERNPHTEDYQVGIIAVDKMGTTGAFSIQKGFSYAIRNPEQNRLFYSLSFIK